jgi:hypothetical protein
LALECGDNIAAYRDAKTAFIEETMLKARNDEGRNSSEANPAKRGDRVNQYRRKWPGLGLKIRAR